VFRRKSLIVGTRKLHTRHRNIYTQTSIVRGRRNNGAQGQARRQKRADKIYKHRDMRAMKYTPTKTRTA